MDDQPLSGYTSPVMSLSRRLLLLLVALLAGLAPAAARDVFVLLSGGASPTSNNYSQYLQARAVAKFFEDNYPADSTWTFFGAGNVTGEAPVFGDVRRQYKQDGLVLESWLPGPLNRNRPAKREEVLRAFREEILPAVRDGGTLYLFVGDHGSTTPASQPYDTTIDLWGVDPAPGTERGWKLVNHEKLTALELRQVLAEGLGRGRVVFCMTQCYSGGFHFLGIPRHVAPNPAWFRGTVPDWAAPGEAEALPLAAGFTAADHYSLAAGCDPDPDPDKWAGYERFVPENLLGLDLFTLEPAGTRRDSFFAAHVEATLVDQTIDKPHATSERYLERWATLIETRLAEEKNLTFRVRRALAAYRRAVDSGRPALRDPALRERKELFDRFTTRLAEQAPSVQDQLRKGKRADLEKLAGKLPPGASFERPASGTSGSSRGTGTSETRKVWREQIQPAWKAAVEAGQIPELANPHVLAFEKTLLAEEAKGRELMFRSGWQEPLLPHIFWASGAHDPATAEPARAEAIARWGAVRRRTIMAWARGHESEEMRTAAATAFPPPRPRSTPAAAAPAPAQPTPAPATTPAVTNLSLRPIQPKIAAERVLLYRRVLAAWAFLIAVKEEPALAKVRELTELERTPLPAGRS